MINHTLNLPYLLHLAIERLTIFVRNEDRPVGYKLNIIWRYMPGYIRRMATVGMSIMAEPKTKNVVVLG